MKKLVITALICLNIGLLVALVLGETPSAEAQNGYYNETEYVLVAGKIEDGRDNIYVIDVAAQSIGSWRFELGRRRLTPLAPRSLATDLRTR